MQERIGWTVAELHKPVPGWHQQIAISVSKCVLYNSLSILQMTHVSSLSLCCLALSWPRFLVFCLGQIPRPSDAGIPHGKIQLLH